MIFKHFFSTLILVALTLSYAHGKTNEIRNINFFQEAEVSKLEIEFDGENVDASRFHLTEDKQIILDVKNVKASKKVLRAFDTSEFAGSVVFISSYKRPGKNNTIRFVVQLRDNVQSSLAGKGNKAILSIENRFGAFAALDKDKIRKKKDLKSVDKLEIFHVPKSNNVEDLLENLTLSGRKKYLGKKISFNVKNITYPDLLKIIADSSGFNIILDKDIEKLDPLTLTLTNIPWDQALDTVLNLGKLVAKKNGNILVITTLNKFIKEKNLELAAERANQKKEPLVTKIFPISFAVINDLVVILKEYSTQGRGTITVDKRTNAIIVKDTMETIEKMKKIVKTLDTQTPQILIEAKIVEATESYQKRFGFGSGVNIGYDPVTPASPTQHNGPGFSFSTASFAGAGNTNFLGLNIERWKKLVNLDLQLQLMESESQGKVISSPKIITENNKEAVITSSETKRFPVQATNDVGVQETAGYEEVSIDLTLKVTPHVTNDGSIAMKVDVEKGNFGTQTDATIPPDVVERKVNTSVLVDNGSTVVIGGIYSFTKLENHQGIPFLKDIPLIGWLFRTAHNPRKDKSELIIFITPRVINQEEAGLAADNTKTI